jgi:anti-sigma B factor antagonist
VDLSIKVEGEGERRTVVLEGSCDLATAPGLRGVLLPLQPPDVMVLTIDASALDHIASTGLGVLIGALRRMREGGGDLVISGAHGRVLETLQLTGLAEVIRLSNG